MWRLLTLLLVAAAACARSGFAPGPCGAQACSGHGVCGVTLEGEPLCACEPGWHNQGALVCRRDPTTPVLPLSDAAVVDLDAGRDAATAVDGSAPVDAAQRLDASMEDAAEDPRNLTWVAIPAGAFEMGCSEGDEDCYPDELPAHSVRLSAFDLTATEITQAQYEATQGVNPSGHAGCPACPVDGLSWDDADAFCQAVGGRLPTEAEWEYAARAGATARFPCGDDPTCLDAAAWFSDNSGDLSHPVAEKAPNAFGLYDVTGNVWEWTADWYAGAYYAASPAQDPPGPPTGTSRVLRGGYYNYDAASQRVSLRIGLNPTDRFRVNGVRCAR